jgi:RNA polymerase sigma-70 factor (ECF subfamily)
MAVVLIDMQGFSVAEAAAVLGTREGTVKSRCARARTRLARLLGHLAPEPRDDGGNAGPPADVQSTTGEVAREGAGPDPARIRGGGS